LKEIDLALAFLLVVLFLVIVLIVLFQFPPSFMVKLFSSGKPPAKK
jgi:hypothetical protein